MYLITNRHLCNEYRYFDVICEAVKSGVENIIIREKDLNNDELANLYRTINYNLVDKGLKANLIINSNISVFEEVKADGIHLPFELFKKKLNDKYEFDNKKILGISTHSIDEIIYLEKIMKDKKIKIDYIILSHIYETDCKKNVAPKGINLLKDANEITNIKIVALGGITPDNIYETYKYCGDIAVMSQIMKSQNVNELVNKYIQKHNK